MGVGGGGRGHVRQWGMCGRGHACQGVCMVVVCGRGDAWQRGAWQKACMVGGMHGGMHAWQGDMCGGGVCMEGGMHGRGHAGHTVNEQAVYILLECILVFNIFPLKLFVLNFSYSETTGLNLSINYSVEHIFLTCPDTRALKFSSLFLLIRIKSSRVSKLL